LTLWGLIALVTIASAGPLLSRMLNDDVQLATNLVTIDESSRNLKDPAVGRSVGSPGDSTFGEVPESLAFATSDNPPNEGSTTTLPGPDWTISNTATSSAPNTTLATTTTAPTSVVASDAAAPATTQASSPSSTAAPSSTSPPATAAPKTTVTTAATTNPPTSANVVLVSTNGRATGSGFSNTPIAEALGAAQPGTTFAFAPGQHQPLKVTVDGASGNSITLTAADRNNRPVFTDGSYTNRAAIEVSGSSHVTLSFLNVRKALWGVRVEGSSGILVDSIRVSDIGQEGIRVTKRSSWVTIRNSVISGTGNRTGTASDGQSYSTFGEGIYIGTGKDPTDAVHHVVVSGNDISNTGTEAIDVKAPVHDVEITNNVIHDIRTGTSGAVVVHVDKYWASAPNIRIASNRITNITTSTPYRDGVAIVVGSSVDVIGNTIHNMAHHGVRIEDKGSGNGKITVNIRDNSFSSIGHDAIYQAGDEATVNTSGNSGA
jgi:hypothetical protein